MRNDYKMFKKLDNFNVDFFCIFFLLHKFQVAQINNYTVFKHGHLCTVGTLNILEYNLLYHCCFYCIYSRIASYLSIIIQVLCDSFSLIKDLYPTI